MLRDLGPRSCRELGVRWVRTFLSAASSSWGVCVEDFDPVTPLEVTVLVELFASVRSTKKTEAIKLFSGVTSKSES